MSLHCLWYECAYSAMNVEAPPYSPPAENPCNSRKETSSIGAQMPIMS